MNFYATENRVLRIILVSGLKEATKWSGGVSSHEQVRSLHRFAWICSSNDDKLTKAQGRTKPMRHISPFQSLQSLETLDLKLSTSALSVGGIMVAAAVSHLHAAPMDDSNPCPQPPPPYPGDDPPIVLPTLPPSGPAGPGS